MLLSPGNAPAPWSLFHIMARNLALAVERTWVSILLLLLTDFMIINNQYLILRSIKFPAVLSKDDNNNKYYYRFSMKSNWYVCVCILDEVYININTFFR